MTRSCRARRILRSHQCTTTNEPLGDSVSENELRRESKTHSFLSWLENQLSYIYDQRIVSCRMKASPPGKCRGSFGLGSILRHLIDPGSPLEVMLVLLELTPRASLKGSCDVPQCGPRRRCARRSWELQRRICRPGSTHACAGAAMMRTLFSDCRSRTRRLAPKYREDVLWALSCFFGSAPPMPFRPSLRCVDGVSMSLLRSSRLSLSASCAVLTAFSPRQSLEQSRHCFSCLRPTFQSRSISTRYT